MAGGRGLSLDEKRVRLLELFHETKDFFTLKELEKLGAKKGVVSQTVKDVLQTLVDDNLVELDKIGISNCEPMIRVDWWKAKAILKALPTDYWSFPSARGAALMSKTKKAEHEIKILEAREAELKASIAASLDDRQDTPERQELLKQWSELKDSVADAQTELAQYTNSGGSEAKARGVVLAKEAALRWTDNLSIAIDYVSKTFSLAGEDVRQMSGIPDNYEDLEDS